jgi:hypothetical protein
MDTPILTGTFYIASRVSKTAITQRVAQHLTNQGMSWTHDWTGDEVKKPYHEHDTANTTARNNMLRGAAQAHVFVFLLEETEHARGALIEYGTFIGKWANPTHNVTDIDIRHIVLIGDIKDPGLASLYYSEHLGRGVKTHHFGSVGEFTNISDLRELFPNLQHIESFT